MLALLLLAIAVLGTLSSTVFLALALVAARRWRRQHALPSRPPASDPASAADHEDDDAAKGRGASVLKPVHGMEPRLRQNLESFFRIEHPEFELVFCARRADDPALQLARELSAQSPAVKVQIIACGEPPWTNAKVYSLEKMTQLARYPVLVISDSDVRVEPGYLRDVAAPLSDAVAVAAATPANSDPRLIAGGGPKFGTGLGPDVGPGVVTCLYRGVPAEDDGLWSRLEALGMSVEMTSGVLIAEMLEGMRFALGPTMATRKDVLETIGGFARMADYASDDYLLGNWAAEAGYSVELSGHVIDHIVLHRDWRSSWAHQVRWMKTTRYSRPKGHFGAGLTFAMPFGLLALAAGALGNHMLLGAALFAWAYLNRVWQSVAIGWGVVRDPRALAQCWLYPARDLLGFFLWMASYGSNEISWRGEKYRMLPGGKMEKIEMK